MHRAVATAHASRHFASMISAGRNVSRAALAAAASSASSVVAVAAASRAGPRVSSVAAFSAVMSVGPVAVDALVTSNGNSSVEGAKQETGLRTAASSAVKAVLSNSPFPHSDYTLVVYDGDDT